MSGSTDGMMAAPPPPPENPVKFTLTKNAGGTSTLTVQFQDKPGAGANTEKPQGGPDMTDPTVMNMVKTMFDGFKIAINLEVLGSIVKTNAKTSRARA